MARHTSKRIKGRTYKRCACVDPATDKRLGTKCPTLKRPNGTWSATHGSWCYQAELPRRADGTRRPLRVGGFPGQTEAQAALDHVAALVQLGEERGPAELTLVGDLIENARRANEPLPAPEEVTKRLDIGRDPDGMPTVADWLENWIDSRKKIRGATDRSYRGHIRLWLTPHLGHYRLDELTIDHISRMFDAMAERNDRIIEARASSDPTVQASVRGMRLMSAATMQRYRATLRAALNAAIRAKRGRKAIPLITFNPASYVELPSGKRPKALLWTPARVRRWEETNEKPSRVMVWLPEQVGEFLDHAYGHPYYPIYHLIAYRGLRRGEACGLSWWETDLEAQEMTISAALVQIGWKAEFGEPKSEASGRIVALDNASTETLREHRQHQNQLRRAAGDAWQETGLVVTNPDGSPVHPAKVTDAFYELAEAAGLPPIRLHDLRHAAATIALAAGASLKEVQALLGHSSITITADTYTHILPDLARDTAEATAALVPRKPRQQPAF
ncbi:tyrosine-type recombinase/integrase [Amycolatopsis aidingensis]|uniref:tyrosine-type recombinase/integrase n=1 Tax=Amycolatopsis aidingensis TaxID=2842453 RepID=UPI001C0CB671|nr:site-specific integrase [Amycolatopsis aidingensis]